MSAPTRVGVGLEWDLEPPPAWQSLIEAAAPRIPGLSWLLLRWEPGDAWQPVERWVIWQMRPKGSVPAPLRRALEGPHPRSSGHWCAAGWCACALKANAWRGAPASAAGIDRMTWELYHATGCYGQRWWVVQGDQGGHRFRLTPQELKLWRLATKTDDVPAAGDLAYAPVDRRVFRQLLAYHQTRMWGAVLALAAKKHKTTGLLDAAEQAEAEAARDAFLAWFEGQVSASVETVGTDRVRRALQALPRVAGAEWTAADERAQELALEQYRTAPHDMADPAAAAAHAALSSL